ncbi:MAG TPA: hypothetical protein VK671_06900 [Mucilaginibacter sp.]|nr:hypothetical protein [Mucilaginibacter sp.]
MSITASAQNTNAKVDTTRKAKTIYQLYEDIKTQPGTSDPLIMVDDSAYNGDIHHIKSDDVSSIEVIKGGDAKQVFGPKAQNGAFIIKTKYYGDKSGTVTGPTRKFSDGPVLYVMDGMPIPKELVNKDDILIKEVVTGKKLEEMGWYPNKKLDSVIIIVTKKSAVMEYQFKFSTFSKKYKDYMKSHQNNDEDFLYVLDGIPVQGKRDDIIRALYKIPSEKIKEVGFNKKQPTDGSTTLVIINTKQ